MVCRSTNCGPSRSHLRLDLASLDGFVPTKGTGLLCRPFVSSRRQPPIGSSVSSERLARNTGASRETFGLSFPRSFAWSDLSLTERDVCLSQCGDHALSCRGLLTRGARDACAGLPLVTTRLAHFERCLRDGEHALFYDSGQPDSLLRVLGRLFEDGALRSRLRQGARKAAEEHFSIVEEARRIACVYDQ